jgi:valyl-tRNA synthetase
MLPLLHPYFPLLSEEFYIQLPKKDKTDNNDEITLLSCLYPTNIPKNIDNNIIHEFEIVSQLIQEIKKERVCFKLARKHAISIIIVCNTQKLESIYKKFNDMLRALCWCKEITINTYNANNAFQLNHSKFTTTVIGDVTIYYDWSTLDWKYVTRLRNKYPKESDDFKRINSMCTNNDTNTSNNKKMPSSHNSNSSSTKTYDSRNCNNNYTSGSKPKTYGDSRNSTSGGGGGRSGKNRNDKRNGYDKRNVNESNNTTGEFIKNEPRKKQYHN